jgi:outer membrane lipoprotein-sorting protein
MTTRFALLCLVLVAMLGKGQNPAPASSPSSAEPELETVLSQMDTTSMTFKSAQADFDWDNYQKVVDETEKQKGRVYFRRQGRDVEAMFEITSPAPKQVLFKSGKLLLYNPKIDQITEYEAGKNKSDVEGFLSLGFGARGHDLLKSYDVKMTGWETTDGVKTAKLELVAKSQRVRNMFSKFVLWIDIKQDVPIRQQVLEPSGDYWLAHYRDIKRNSRIPDSVFRIKSTPNTKTVRPQ